jgi:hypothetical protein
MLYRLPRACALNKDDPANIVMLATLCCGSSLFRAPLTVFKRLLIGIEITFIRADIRFFIITRIQ